MTIRKSEEILKNLMKNKDYYNENDIDDYMRKWECDRENALLGIGLEKGYFTEEKFKKLLSFEIFKDNFDNYDNFDKFCNRLSRELKEKFLELSKFYYYMCKEPSIYKVSDESFKLIIMTSTIEALMTDYEYKEFNEWFNTNCSEEVKNKIIIDGKDLKSQINKLWDEYKKIHGSTRKIKTFFDKFLNNDDKEKLIAGFEKLDNKNTKSKEVAEWLYSMRSKFVHEAHPTPLHEERCTVGCVISDKVLIIDMSIGEILSIFERGFIEYFRKRYEENK